MPECPDWLPEEAWQAFVAHRAAQRKPMTPQSAIQTLRGLDKARGFGHDPTALIEAAIGAGWQGCVFPDKHFSANLAVPRGGRRPGDKREATMARNGDALSAWLGDSVSVSVVPPKEITHATH